MSHLKKLSGALSGVEFSGGRQRGEGFLQCSEAIWLHRNEVVSKGRAFWADRAEHDMGGSSLKLV